MGGNSKEVITFCFFRILHDNVQPSSECHLFFLKRKMWERVREVERWKKESLHFIEIYVKFPYSHYSKSHKQETKRFPNTVPFHTYSFNDHSTFMCQVSPVLGVRISLSCRCPHKECWVLHIFFLIFIFCQRVVFKLLI